MEIMYRCQSEKHGKDGRSKVYAMWKEMISDSDFEPFLPLDVSMVSVVCDTFGKRRKIEWRNRVKCFCWTSSVCARSGFRVCLNRLRNGWVAVRKQHSRLGGKSVESAC
jgi:hypothetical protein